MVRKYLFAGLLIMLATIVLWMILQTRRQEKMAAAAAAGLVKSVRTTPTRAFAPADLRIVRFTIETAFAEGGLGQAAPAAKAVHGISVRNDGGVAYVRLMLEFAYLAGDGRELGTKRHLAGDIRLGPGQELALDPIAVEGVPRAAVGCRPRIVWAETERAGASGGASKERSAKPDDERFNAR